MRIFARFLVGIILCFSSVAAFAHQSCENVVVGQNPIYGAGNQVVGWQPIYEQRCTWYYAAIAIDPQTRKTAYVYNYTDINEAENYVLNACGPQCIMQSANNVAYIALSESGRFWGTSTVSAQDAISSCVIAGGITDACDWAIMTGTGSAAVTHHYGSIAYDVSSAWGGRSWLADTPGSAKSQALKSCEKKDCWAYAFDSLAAAIAKNKAGQLFGRGEISLDSAKREALNDCKTASKNEECQIAIAGYSIMEISAEEQAKPIDSKAVSILKRIFN